MEIILTGEYWERNNGRNKAGTWCVKEIMMNQVGCINDNNRKSFRIGVLHTGLEKNF